MGFYGSNDPTNSVKAVKEVVVLRTGFSPTRPTSPCNTSTHACNNTYTKMNLSTQWNGPRETKPNSRELSPILHHCQGIENRKIFLTYTCQHDPMDCQQDFCHLKTRASRRPLSVYCTTSWAILIQHWCGTERLTPYIWTEYAQQVKIIHNNAITNVKRRVMQTDKPNKVSEQRERK